MYTEIAIEYLNKFITSYPDWPIPGVVFKDINPVYANPVAKKFLLKAFGELISSYNFDGVVGIDARGFIMGSSIADYESLPFILARKAGKLPGQTHNASYSLEYGEAVIEMQHDLLLPLSGKNVIVYDDILATGGTAAAVGEILLKLDITPHFLFIGVVPGLGGVEKLQEKFKNSSIQCLVDL